MSKKGWALISGIAFLLAVTAGFLYMTDDTDEEKDLFPVPELETSDLSEETTFKSAISFENISEKVGIDFHYEDGATGLLYLPETFGGGVALIDYDSDSLLDVYLVQGGMFPPDSSSVYRNRLFRNQGNGLFVDVTEQSAVGNNGYGQGVAVGDYDNDGYRDLYVTNYGPDVLFRNDGDGTFTDVTDAAGLGSERWGVGCAFGDLDGDGDLDLYVSTYAVMDLSKHRLHVDNAGFSIHPQPTTYPGEDDILYRNNGDGTFSDVTEESGMEDDDGRGMGVVISDFNEDGRQDVFVANDQTNNFFFVSEGAMQFKERGWMQGLAVNQHGTAEGSMGVAYGDVDGDGHSDLMVTNYYTEINTLFRYDRDGVFEDRTTWRMGLGPATKNMVAWGTQFVDFNNDSWLDLFCTNGHVDNLEKQTQLNYGMKAQVFINRGKGTFEEVTEQSGDYFQDRWVGRGAAFGDIDNDGDMDVAVTHLPYERSRFALLENKTLSKGNALILKLVGSHAQGVTSSGRFSSRDAVGARILATLGDQLVFREIIGGGSYLSASDLRVVLGVGDAEQIDQLEILWPSGRVQNLGTVVLKGPVTALSLVEGAALENLKEYQLP